MTAEYFQPFFYSSPGEKVLPTESSLWNFTPQAAESLDDQFSWMIDLPVQSTYTFKQGQELERIQSQLKDLGLQLPVSFEPFFRQEFPNRIRSSTDDRFDLIGHPEELENSGGLVFLPFIYDSQFSNFYYLVWNKDGNHCVVRWGNLIGFPDDQLSDRTEVGPEFFSFSFREAVYRYWMDNEIWFRTERNGKPLTEKQKEYLDW